MSTREEALAARNRLSEYNIYHEGEEHVYITPFLDLTKEYGFKKKHTTTTADYTPHHRGTNDANSYFIHRPVLFFHDPPRTLRRGSKKNGEPICIIKSSMFWRQWTLQFASNLPDIIDPRGLIRWEHRSRPDNKVGADDRALNGYKVRTWRAWGESGKNYHRMVNWRRKTQPEKPEEASSYEPAVAEEAVQLKWSSPLSNTRRYQFHYAGIEFFWEGTRDLPELEVWSKRLMPLNHLKLIAQIPGRERIYVGYYVSSTARKKFGRLFIFDSAISRALEESGHSPLATRQVEPEKGFAISPEPDIRHTRIYEVVMATSMCMVIGEWQKRMTVWFIVIMVAQAGNGANIAAGGGGC